MHPEIQREKPGRCPKCGMELIPEKQMKTMQTDHAEKIQNSYQPLIVIISLLVLVTGVLALRDFLIGQFRWQTTMMHFMAGFFLVFSGFKLLDLKGFAEGYSTYDLLAQRVFSYGYMYPFIELYLGLLYTVQFVSPRVNLFTFILMAFSGIGVLIKLIRKEKFQCACLGTFLKVPLTKVTLVEDFGMAAMALLMLVTK